MLRKTFVQKGLGQGKEGVLVEEMVIESVERIDLAADFEEVAEGFHASASGIEVAASSGVEDEDAKDSDLGIGVGEEGDESERLPFDGREAILGLESGIPKRLCLVVRRIGGIECGGWVRVFG